MSNSIRVSWGEVSRSDVPQVRHIAEMLTEKAVDKASLELLDNARLAAGEVAANIAKYSNGDSRLEMWFEVVGNHLVACFKNPSHCEDGNREFLLDAMACGAANAALESCSKGREGGMGLALLGALTVERSIETDGTMRLHFSVHKALACLPLGQASLS